MDAYRLGQQIAARIDLDGTDPTASALHDALIAAPGVDSGLLAPLRDLLSRPDFQRLLAARSRSRQSALREVLLHDLFSTYQAAVVAQLALVIDGCLGQPPGPLPATVFAAAFQADDPADGVTDPLTGADDDPWPPRTGPYRQGLEAAVPPGVNTPVVRPVGNRRLAAGLAAIFLGGLGIHKFVLGYTQAGVVMLLLSLAGGLITCFTSTFVMFVIGMIEGILYLTRSDDDFRSIYIDQKRPWF